MITITLTNGNAINMLVAIAICILAASSYTQAQLRMNDRCTVKIRCASGDCAGLSSNGFLFLTNRQVLTTLHGVSGADKILVYSPIDKSERTATIIKSSAKLDLALLQLSDSFNITPILSIDTILNYDDTYTCPSIYHDSYSIGNRKLQPLKMSAPKLSLAIPGPAAQEIRTAGCPDIDMPVYFWESNPILPTNSGAPILSSSNKLIAVADGGLERGAASISWGIPAKYIYELLAGKETTRLEKCKFATVHTSGYNSAGYSPTNTSLEHWVTRSTISFSDLYRFGSGYTSLITELTSLSPIIINYSNFKFDILQNTETGATIVIPAGYKLVKDRNLLKLELYNSSIRFWVNYIPNFDTQDELNSRHQLFLIESLMNTQGWNVRNITPNDLQIRFDSLKTKHFMMTNQNSSYPRGARVYTVDALKRHSATTVHVFYGEYDHDYSRSGSNWSEDKESKELAVQKITLWMRLIIAAALTTYSI